MRLRTRSWYGDDTITVRLPEKWKVEVFAPELGVPLSDGDIADRLDSPVGQPSIRELLRGKARPVIVVDDLNRPTPAFRVLPALLRQFAQAGIAPGAVSIVMGPGTHGAPAEDAFAKKVGEAAARECALHVHDCNRDLVSLGRTSFGTPVLVSRHILAGDFVIGIGGVYPNQTAGYGGGSKLALGVLGFRSIAGLHLGHTSMGWGTPSGSSHFRRDLDEIARMIGLRTTISLVLNSHREVVELCCGDPDTYHADLVRRVQLASRAPIPDRRVDVVICNAYPADMSLTFVRMKAMQPLINAPLTASRISVASCSEGLGYHGLYPFLNAPRLHRARMLAMRARVLSRRPGQLAFKLRRRFSSKRRAEDGHSNPIWLYRPEGSAAQLPDEVPGIRLTSSWNDVLEGISWEQGDRRNLQVAVYPCAPLQWSERT